GCDPLKLYLYQLTLHRVQSYLLPRRVPPSLLAPYHFCRQSYYSIGGNSQAGIGVIGLRQVMALKPSRSTVKHIPVARKSVTGLFFGKNGHTLLCESIEGAGISQSSVTGRRSSKITQFSLPPTNFLARKMGDSTHPKKDWQLSSGGD